MQIKLPLL